MKQRPLPVVTQAPRSWILLTDEEAQALAQGVVLPTVQQQAAQLCESLEAVRGKAQARRRTGA